MKIAKARSNVVVTILGIVFHPFQKFSTVHPHILMLIMMATTAVRQTERMSSHPRVHNAMAV